MPKFLVKARVLVPAWGQLVVEAATVEEAKATALSPVDSAGEDAESEWQSKIWNDGGWLNGIEWCAAEDFTLEEVRSL